jgi:hypothetical protein
MCVWLRTHTLLDHSNLAFDLGDMFVGCGSVKHDAGHGKVMFQWDKFAIHKHGFDMKAGGGVKSLHVSCCKDQLWKFTVGNVLCSGELDVITDGSKKSNPIDKKISPDKEMCLLAERIWGGTAT